MYLLDTHVLSEALRLGPQPNIIRCLLACNLLTLFASQITRFETCSSASLRADAPLFWARIQCELLPLVT